MIYSTYEGLELSQLGMGCMRLPRFSDDDSDVDIPQTKEMLATALAAGVNYIDTAYGYHDHRSEEIIGELLKHYPRDSFNLASKFPGYDANNWDHVEEIFEEQLKKCQVDHFDFYLIHNVCEMNIDAYLDEEQYGIVPYLLKQKEAGRIKHLGFSVHALNDDFDRFLAQYANVMEFCQVQLNYVDWHFQKAEYKVQRLNQLNIPIWVMEPLRGGKLATLPEECMNKLDRFRPGLSPVEWAFRFLQSVPGVTVILSGASSLEQMKDNLKIFETDNPLTNEEIQVLFEIGETITDGTVPCTSCNYCASYCPMHLTISKLISYYNQRIITGPSDFLAPMAISKLPEDKRPSACIGCRSCEAVCPQQIPIADVMSDFTKLLE